MYRITYRIMVIQLLYLFGCAHPMYLEMSQEKQKLLHCIASDEFQWIENKVEYGASKFHHAQRMQIYRIQSIADIADFRVEYNFHDGDALRHKYAAHTSCMITHGISRSIGNHAKDGPLASMMRDDVRTYFLDLVGLALCDKACNTTNVYLSTYNTIHESIPTDRKYFSSLVQDIDIHIAILSKFPQVEHVLRDRRAMVRHYEDEYEPYRRAQAWKYYD